MTPVQFIAIGLTDPVDEPELQGNDRDACQRLGQQFQRRVRDSGIQYLLIQFGLAPTMPMLRTLRRIRRMLSSL